MQLLSSSGRAAPRQTHALRSRLRKVPLLQYEPLEARTVLSAAAVADTASAADDVLADDPVQLLGTSPPMGQDGGAMLEPNETYTFFPSDFGYSDPSDSPPDNFEAVVIASLPAKGSLTYAGFGVQQFQSIPIEEISAGQLQYTPSQFDAGSLSTSFTFQVVDDGLSNNIDPTPNTFSLYVDDADAAFVRSLYQDVLGRDPKPAGLTNWLDHLTAGSTREDIARGLWQSAEHRGIQIDGYYQQFLNRDPNPFYRQGWIDLMLSGASEEFVMASFLTTEEYRLNHLLNDEFVIGVYQDVLNRNPATSGLAFWTGLLDGNTLTRFEVAMELIETRERHLTAVDTYYNEFLERDAEPAGVTYWSNLLDQDSLEEGGLAIELLATEEYYLRAQA